VQPGLQLQAQQRQQELRVSVDLKLCAAASSAGLPSRASGPPAVLQLQPQL
jgi:hypothetical protein